MVLTSRVSVLCCSLNSFSSRASSFCTLCMFSWSLRSTSWCWMVSVFFCVSNVLSCSWSSFCFVSKVLSSARIVGFLSWLMFSLMCCFSILRSVSCLVLSRTSVSSLVSSFVTSCCLVSSSSLYVCVASKSPVSRWRLFPVLIMSASSSALSSLSFVMAVSCCVLFSVSVVIVFSQAWIFSLVCVSAVVRLLSLKLPVFLCLNPPIIAPEISQRSPSRVTILFVPMPMARAVSILSTMSVLPKTWEKTFLNWGSYWMRSTANPSVPAFFAACFCSGVMGCPLILFRGKNVAMPSLFSLRYLMQRAAVLSSSTTTLFMRVPAAISSAREYFVALLPSSETVPWIVPSLFFCSITFLTAMVLPALSSMTVFFTESFACSS